MEMMVTAAMLIKMAITWTIDVNELFWFRRSLSSKCNKNPEK